ncbi:uncharacterized protein isoform X1 [Rhodnius prolixus]|uniref:uncharacterized protein isoform X1 n=1 Tax=Rhodnius prolixus TaxID=13249 RepID=UPI003D18B08B
MNPNFKQFSCLRFSCHCGRSYKHKRTLYNHHKFECGKQPMFECSECPFRAKFKWNLKTHMTVRHFKTSVYDFLVIVEDLINTNGPFINIANLNVARNQRLNALNVPIKLSKKALCSVILLAYTLKYKL